MKPILRFILGFVCLLGYVPFLLIGAAVFSAVCVMEKLQQMRETKP